MYNDESYEEFKQGKNLFVKIFLSICIILGIIAIFFTDYKQETLKCSKTQDKCTIERTNLLNIKNKKFLIKYSDIKNVTYKPKNVKGNAYAKGYTAYYLSFNNKKNMQLKIFLTSYFEKDEVKKAVQELKQQMKKQPDNIEFNRN